MNTVKGKGVAGVENAASNHSMAVPAEQWDAWQKGLDCAAGRDGRETAHEKSYTTAAMDPRAFKDVIGLKPFSALSPRKIPNVIYLDADLMSCIGTCKWSARKPDARHSTAAFREANMIGVACGLAADGVSNPSCTHSGPFASRRVFDQVFLSAGYAHNDITVIGTDPGVCASFNGGTHMPFEDVALYRTIPTATIIDVTDANMLISVLRQCKDRSGRQVHPRRPQAGRQGVCGWRGDAHRPRDSASKKGRTS